MVVCLSCEDAAKWAAAGMGAAFIFKNKFYLFVDNFIHVYSAFAPSPFLWNLSSQRVSLFPYLFIYLLSVCLSLSPWLVASAFTP